MKKFLIILFLLILTFCTKGAFAIDTVKTLSDAYKLATGSDTIILGNTKALMRAEKIFFNKLRTGKFEDAGNVLRFIDSNFPQKFVKYNSPRVEIILKYCSNKMKDFLDPDSLESLGRKIEAWGDLKNTSHIHRQLVSEILFQELFYPSAIYYRNEESQFQSLLMVFALKSHLPIIITENDYDKVLITETLWHIDINEMTEYFLKDFPDSRFRSFVIKYIQPKYRLSKLGMGLSVGVGRPGTSGPLYYRFRELLGLSAEMEIKRSSLSLLLFGNSMHANLNDNIVFNDRLISKETIAINTMGMNLAYEFFSDRQISIMPNFGYNFTQVSFDDSVVSDFHNPLGFNYGVRVKIRMPKIKHNLHLPRSHNFTALNFGVFIGPLEQLDPGYIGNIYYISIFRGFIFHPRIYKHKSER